MKKKNNYSMILLCTQDTIYEVKNNYDYFIKYLAPKEIIVIANKNVKKIIEQEKILVQFLDEDNLYKNLNYQNVKNLLKARINDESVTRRTGWYLQQFLKMGYCVKCETESYLVWDSDTIPCRETVMYTLEGKKIFDVKSEYHKPYFSTMEKLLPELKKKNDYSFISEHMLIDKNIMLDLITKIESISEIEGENFWEKILNAIEKAYLPESGFSEFETYGTFVEYYYKDEYEIRKWKSLREGTIFFKNGVNEDILKYLGQEYDAISFEVHSLHKKLQKFFSWRICQNLFMIRIIENLKEFLAHVVK